MKGLIFTMIGLSLILLVSYIVIDEELSSFTPKTAVINDNIGTGSKEMNTFVMEQEPTGYSELVNTQKQTRDMRKYNIEAREREEEIDKCIQKITKNWERTYTKKSYEQADNEEPVVFWETDYSVFGYDEDEDFRLRWELRNRALNGEKIC